MVILTNLQARQFILLKNGLLGEYAFEGKQGTLEFIKQAGCIQFDPIDVCGKNPELVLQSRVKNFKKKYLDELLYKDRRLFDYVDKNLSILPVEDWPYFERYRQIAKREAKKYPQMQTLQRQVYSYIEKNGVVCSADIKLDADFFWRSTIHWSGGNNVARSVMEQMYSSGELVVHHKNGTRKYYDLAENHISAELLGTPEPLPSDLQHRKWRVLRRIGTVGLLWNRPSDAWMSIRGLKAEERNKVFSELLKEKAIMEVSIEGLKDIFYCITEDMPLVEAVLKNPTLKPRCEFIAPLDNFMWDRRLIKALFGFDYTWEIYTPQEKRQYGYYTLPILYGESFIGRIEAIVERKTSTLVVKNIWYEDRVKQTEKLKNVINSTLKRFAKFNECSEIRHV